MKRGDPNKGQTGVLALLGILRIAKSNSYKTKMGVLGPFDRPGCLRV